MLTQLESYPRLATPVGQAAPPSVRWSGRPAHPAEALDDPVGAWKGLVAEAFLARSSLDNAAHLPGPERRVVLRDLAVLTEAFASATRDLAHGADLPLGDAGRTQVMELASAARRVQRHAGAHPGTSGPDLAASKERRTVRTVGTVAALPAAVQNLTRLTATGPTSTATLFSTTIVVTRLAQATSEALRAAARSPRAADPERLRGAADSLTQFASELGRVVTTHQRELASLPRGCPATLAQARELGASGQPRIRDLAPRPDIGRRGRTRTPCGRLRTRPHHVGDPSPVRRPRRRGTPARSGPIRGHPVRLETGQPTGRRTAAWRVRPGRQGPRLTPRRADRTTPQPRSDRETRLRPGGRPTRGPGAAARRPRLPPRRCRSRASADPGTQRPGSMSAPPGSWPLPGPGGAPVPEGLQGDEAADIDALVEELLGTTPRPVNWSRLSPDQAAARWAALDEWVRWLARRYSLDHRDLPPCWYAHGDLVEELSALHTAHQAAFDPGGPGDGARRLASAPGEHAHPNANLDRADRLPSRPAPGAGADRMGHRALARGLPLRPGRACRRRPRTPGGDLIRSARRCAACAVRGSPQQIPRHRGGRPDGPAHSPDRIVHDA